MKLVSCLWLYYSHLNVTGLNTVEYLFKFGAWNWRVH